MPVIEMLQCDTPCWSRGIFYVLCLLFGQYSTTTTHLAKNVLINRFCHKYLKEFFYKPSKLPILTAMPSERKQCKWLAGSPATPLSPHFLPGYVWAEPGRTGCDLECGTFYPSGEKERFLSYLGMTSYVQAWKRTRHLWTILLHLPVFLYTSPSFMLTCDAICPWYFCTTSLPQIMCLLCKMKCPYSAVTLVGEW